MTASAEKQHSSLGASNAHRWMPCPGSVNMAAALAASPSSKYAEEGTRAHTLGEVCLRTEADPASWLGKKIDGTFVTQEMVDAVTLYVQTCRELRDVNVEWRIEQRFDLSPLKPPVPMFGTADFVAYDPDEYVLDIVDLKYGMGVVVEAKGNVQLQYYALGAAVSPEQQGKKIKRVRMTIVQPRAGHPDGPVRTWEITFEELVEFGVRLLVAANATTAADAPRIAGKQCRWCPASGICPEQREQALAVAQTDFSLVTAKSFAPPTPETIPLAEFAAMLSQIHVLEDWASSMRATAQARLERGEEVPGWKLIDKRATRQWIDVGETIERLRAAGFDDNEIFAEPTIKSVAQMEKVSGGKKAFEKLDLGIKKESSGYRLAPASDPAPAVVLTVGSEFSLLPAGSPEDE